MAPGEAERVFCDYFAIFPWDHLPPYAEGFDIGCGSGRWARFVAPRVCLLHCIDLSSTLANAGSDPESRRGAGVAGGALWRSALGGLRLSSAENSSACHCQLLDQRQRRSLRDPGGH